MCFQCPGAAATRLKKWTYRINNIQFGGRIKIKFNLSSNYCEVISLITKITLEVRSSNLDKEGTKTCKAYSLHMPECSGRIKMIYLVEGPPFANLKHMKMELKFEYLPME